jgi:hypothetical protein
MTKENFSGVKGARYWNESEKIGFALLAVT